MLLEVIAVIANLKLKNILHKLLGMTRLWVLSQAKVSG